MGGTASAQKAPVALEIEVELGRVRNFSVNDSSSSAIATAVRLGCFLVLREKSNVMSFANDNDGNLGLNTQLSTSA